MSDLNPCMSCGACCAYFRVSFYWAEADDAGGSVPAQLTEPVTPFYAVCAEPIRSEAIVSRWKAFRVSQRVAVFMSNDHILAANL